MPYAKKEDKTAQMQRWRSFQSAKHTLQDNWEKDTEAKYIIIREPTDDPLENERTLAMNLVTCALLYRTAQKVRKIDNLDDMNKIYQELWKELDSEKAKIWRL